MTTNNDTITRALEIIAAASGYNFGGAVRDGARANESAYDALAGYTAALAEAGFVVSACDKPLFSTAGSHNGWYIEISVAASRRIGDGGEVRCGDIMHDGTCHGDCGLSRRLCGECCRTVERDGRREMACEAGCGEVLERWSDSETIEPPPGWEDRAVERARREGVLR